MVSPVHSSTPIAARSIYYILTYACASNVFSSLEIFASKFCVYLSVRTAVLSYVHLISSGFISVRILKRSVMELQ